MIRTGSQVEWKWGNGTAKGEVVEIFKREVTRTIEGSEVTKKGSDDCPAYLIKQDDNSKVLKLKSELKGQ
ncbi:MAG: hypothetical protein CME62_06600 [Halobacteriovoraceae bacterium]|nr:hypothetical protein [Halobacteriovoraceae bacterium]|tara:strand:+ start:38824 stop:39033 length:210 start_codon:yes stop_codon:yes gene_type:complete